MDGLDASRVNTIVEVACARFEQFQNLKAELAEANLRLSERKLVERAKGLLMQSRGLSEDAAFHALRKLAMSRKQRLGDVAQQVVDTAELLGKTRRPCVIAVRRALLCSAAVHPSPVWSIVFVENSSGTGLA